MLNKLTIRSRLIVLIGLMSLVSLGVGVVGLIQSSNGERAFDRIFSNRVVSIGYLKNVEVAYTVQIIGAANKYSDGVLSSEEALDGRASRQRARSRRLGPGLSPCSRRTWTSSWRAGPRR